MKIIDILNKKANGTLEDRFKFCYRDEVFTYDKKLDRIYRGNSTLNKELGEVYKLERCLNEEVLLFQKEVKESDKRESEENKEIEEFTSTIGSYHSKKTICQYCNAQTAKINELIRTVNKSIKEREEK